MSFCGSYKIPDEVALKLKAKSGYEGFVYGVGTKVLKPEMIYSVGHIESMETGSVFFECKEGPFVEHEKEGVLRLQR